MVISEILSAQELTDNIGMEPDIARDRNDVMLNGKLRGFSSWELSSKVEVSLDIQNQISVIMPRMLFVKNKVKDLVDKNEAKVTLSIAVYVREGRTPSIFIEEKYITFLSEIRCSFAVDLYVFPFDDDDDSSFIEKIQ